MAGLNGANGTSTGSAAPRDEAANFGVVLAADEYDEFRRQLDADSDVSAEQLRVYLSGEVATH
ncbi:MAG: hypothetical protein JWL65_1534 [Gammaproteobacteria bacterium]|nr:hypothetical protein [Gammaproteobacteria bacterium]